MKIYVGCDHAGLELKLKVMALLPEFQWEDMGTFSSESVDYPDYADKVCKALTEVELENIKKNIQDSSQGPAMGILICGSGQGMAIRANKYPHIRAALCWNEEIAHLSREHNNANLLSFGSRFISQELAIRMINEFVHTNFAGGRHQNRVQKLSADTHC